MNKLTTTAHGKELKKIIQIPKELMKMKFKVTIEPISDKKEIIDEMEKIFNDSKLLRIKSKINIDKISNELNSDLF